MPDDNKKPQTAQEAEAAYAAGQKPAPAVPLRWHPQRGELPGVPIFKGTYTAEQTAQYLTRAQYEAVLRDGIASVIEAPKAEGAVEVARPKKATEAPKAGES